MSKIYVDEILPKDAANISAPNLQLPAGSVIQVQRVVSTTPMTLSPGVSSVFATLDFTPKFANSKLLIKVGTSNLQKATGAGVSTWANIFVQQDGTRLSELQSGAIGYPETYSNHRYTFSFEGEITAHSGTKTYAIEFSVASTGSNWTLSYQDHPTYMTIMEIAQ